MTTSLAALALLPTIWVVDASNGPGTHFTNLPAAVAAAQSGDTILVKHGSYAHFAVSGKALTIRGEGAASTIVEAPFYTPNTSGTVVDAVPPGETFFIDGLKFRIAIPPFSAVSTPAIPLKLIGGGELFLSDVTAEGMPAVGGPDFRHGFAATSGSAHAQRCTFVGGGSSAFPFNPAFGASGVRVAAGATFGADACTFVGGVVGGASFVLPNRGGYGLEVAGGIATVYGSSFHGGDNLGPGPGGAGVSVSAGGFVRLAGSAADVVQGGSAATATEAGPAVLAAPGGAAYLHGALTLAAGSAVAPALVGATTVGATLPRLSLSGVADANGELLANQNVVLTADGVLPGAPFLLAVHVAPAYSQAYAAYVVGETLLPVETALLLPGDLDASAAWSLPMNPSLDAPALVGAPFYLQMFVLDAAAGNLRASSLLKILYRN